MLQSDDAVPVVLACGSRKEIDLVDVVAGVLDRDLQRDDRLVAQDNHQKALDWKDADVVGVVLVHNYQKTPDLVAGFVEDKLMNTSDFAFVVQGCNLQSAAEATDLVVAHRIRAEQELNYGCHRHNLHNHYYY